MKMVRITAPQHEVASIVGFARLGLVTMQNILKMEGDSALRETIRGLSEHTGDTAEEVLDTADKVVARWEKAAGITPEERGVDA